jgi:hypothetical protein
MKPPPHRRTLSSCAFRSKSGVVLRRWPCWLCVAAEERACVRAVAPSPRLRRAVALGWGASSGGREDGKGRRGAWQHVPTHTSVPMPIARSLRVAQCHLSLGSRRHSVESGHAPADRSATWLRFRGGSSNLPITLQRATAVCRCVWTVRAPRPSSSRVRVLAGLRDRQRQARCAA